MPELPEVETVVRALRPLLMGRRVLTMRADWPRHIDRPSPVELRRRIRGCTVTALTRRGKYILIHLSGHEHLLIHLRMSGHLSVVAHNTPADKHTHTIFGLDDGRELRFRDPRKFGRVWLVTDPHEVVGDLGPEPLAAEFTAGALRERLRGHHRIVKPLLLDQSFIAGIGNIYADEALFLARLRPTRRSHTLRAREVEALHAGIRAALREGIAREGASIDTYVKPDGQKGGMQHAVKVFRRTGKPCTRCGGTIRRIVLGQRSTHFCPGCQK
jgi:formamidopyrimidine-DNA glycosylase